MKRKGFTLMELLLVVAILAIVAAAAAPTFTSGASDALKEARKSGFLSAYQNTVTGAHMMIAIAASKGVDIVGANDTDKDLDTGTDSTDGVGADKHNLNYYSPIATRQFKNSKGNVYTLGAVVDKDHKLYIIYKKGESATSGTKIEISGAENQDSSTVLNATWNAIEEEI